MILQKLNELFNADDPPQASRPDARQAVAELLVHASRVDDHVDPAEIAARDRLLKQKFGLDDTELRALVDEARKADDQAIDFHRFTSVIKNAYSREQRETIMEMLCEIILADGHLDADERNMGWRVAGLLGFDNREWITILKRVEQRMG